VSDLEAARVEEVARVLAGRVPGHDASSIACALRSGGFATRIALAEREAPTLLRELYAAGVPPAGTILRPLASLAAGEAGADDQFALFARRAGRFAFTWSWAAFVLGPFWYLRHGIYLKGLVLLGLSAYPLWSLSTSLQVSLGVLVYCGLAGHWDRYLWKVKGTQLW
jgi:hypothetical protein